MVYILRVLSKEDLDWNTYHMFEENKTQISFEWEKGDKERLRINGGDYFKVLNIAEILVFKALLEHVFDEKIARSTVIPKNGGFKKSVGPESNNKKSELTVTEETVVTSRPESRNTTQVLSSPPQVEKVYITDPETVTVGGVCEGETEKALLIGFEGAQPIWIPKSTIRSDFDSGLKIVQQFTIDSWILKKNKVMD